MRKNTQTSLQSKEQGVRAKASVQVPENIEKQKLVTPHQVVYEQQRYEKQCDSCKRVRMMGWAQRFCSAACRTAAWAAAHREEINRRARERWAGRSK